MSFIFNLIKSTFILFLTFLKSTTFVIIFGLKVIFIIRIVIKVQKNFL
ncbi:hypothetical protein SAMN05661096_01075 [Marivirga sericea]|uniref:Uncharacterized protein n=1 Tax=Marivirga sericea TaxID=1028 RepID=A0A1X7IZ10_9BACT|nr:hypothetical protein SAMN05661096_01075 [Marivirga sericea]